MAIEKHQGIFAFYEGHSSNLMSVGVLGEGIQELGLEPGECRITSTLRSYCITVSKSTEKQQHYKWLEGANAREIRVTLLYWPHVEGISGRNSDGKFLFGKRYEKLRQKIQKSQVRVEARKNAINPVSHIQVDIYGWDLTLGFETTHLNWKYR